MDLEQIAERIRGDLTRKQSSRDEALRLSRETIRFCATSIRSTHRGESDQASHILDEARDHLGRLLTAVADYPDLQHTGFVDDAQKEFAEANATHAIVFGHPFPTPEDIGVDDAPYLNGLGEAAGELRRFILDRIREGEFQRCERALEAMEEIYRVLVTIDFPDAMTGGLRRTTDMVRGVLERTRGDLTMAIRQQGLVDQLAKFQDSLGTQTPADRGSV
jgi:translin